MKSCCSCKRELDSSSFWKKKSSKDGLQERCKLCTQQFRASQDKGHVLAVRREWAAKNREQVNRYSAEYKERNPDKTKAEAQAWLKSHKSILADRLREKRAEDPEKYKSYAQEYRRLHPEIHRRNNHNRRARLAQVLSTLTQDQWEAILDLFGGRCAYCGSDDKITLDHVVPLSKGGSHAEDNVLPACKTCNSSKHTRDVVEWAKARPDLTKTSDQSN